MVSLNPSPLPFSVSLSGLPDLQYRAVYDPRTADENSLVTLRYQGDEQWLLSGDLEAA